MDQFSKLMGIFMLINYCQKKTGMNYGLYSATLLNQKDFQSMLHILLNAIR